MNTFETKTFYRWVGVFFIVLYIILHLGFYRTFFIHFPEFENFTMLHHIHGGVMSSWIALLIVQSFLAQRGNFSWHKFLGKVSYIHAPVVIVFMYLILRYSYYRQIDEISIGQTMPPLQIVTWSELLAFTIFYILAMINKKDKVKHIRYMVGTGLVMVIPGFGRFMGKYLGITAPGSFYVAIIFALCFLLWDYFKGNNYKPALVVFSVITLILFNFYIRNSEGWLEISQVLVKVLY